MNNESIRQPGGNSKTQVSTTVDDLLNDGKKLAHELYEDGLQKVASVEDEMKEYSDKLMRNVQENPLTAILIAGGIGFLLSTLFKK